MAAGFAIVEPESKMTISAVEATQLGDIDAGSARKYASDANVFLHVY